MKAEFKIMFCLVATLAALEVSARLFETQLSINIAHLRDLPQQAAHIRNAPVESFKIVVIGNSLARCGIDVENLKKGLREKLQRDVVVAMLHPDGTRIEEWAYAYRRYFEQTGAKPDAVLMVTGRLHLTDQLPNVSEMGAFYVSPRDLGHFASHQLQGVEEWARFWAARVSSLFTHRERLQPLLFYHLVPGYEETTKLINEGMAAPTSTTSDSLALHCDALNWLAADLRETGVKLLIASAPMPVPYKLPALVLQTAETAGSSIWQSGATMALPKDYFPDGYHLNAQGAKQFTQDIVDHLNVAASHGM